MYEYGFTQYDPRIGQGGLFVEYIKYILETEDGG